MAGIITGLDVLGSIAPQTVAAAGTAVTGWIDTADHLKMAAIFKGGELGTGSAAITWEQASDDSGTGAKALAVAAATGAPLGTNNEMLEQEFDCSLLDRKGGFRYVQATLTVTGGTGALLSAVVLGLSPRYEP